MDAGFLEPPHVARAFAKADDSAASDVLLGEPVVIEMALLVEAGAVPPLRAQQTL
jgi:hypothetical protein